MKKVKLLEHELTAAARSCLNQRMAKGTGKPTKTEVQAIAGRLIAARLAMRLTQAELCRRTDILPHTYNQWEQAKGAPSRLQARKLRRELGWTLDYIYEGDPSALPHAIAVKLKPEVA